MIPTRSMSPVPLVVSTRTGHCTGRLVAAWRRPVRESIVLVGAGGLGREVLEAVRACDAGERWDVRGFLDDSPDAPATVAGVPVLGPSSVVKTLGADRALLCVAHPARPEDRSRLQDRL